MQWLDGARFTGRNRHDALGDWTTPARTDAILLGSGIMMLDLTGEIADGWLGTSFVPECADATSNTSTAAWHAKAGRTRDELDICQGAEVAFVDDPDALSGVLASWKKELAFSLGGMGSAKTNFSNRAYARQGWQDAAAAVRERWQAGGREGAAALVTDERVLPPR